MTFAGQVRAFSAKAERNIRAVHETTVVELKKSWVEGSPVTGAPQLPMAQEASATRGKLRRGVRVIWESAQSALIVTSVKYAEEVEHNVRGVKFSEGGPHGWKLTVAGAGRVATLVAKRIAGYGR